MATTTSIRVDGFVNLLTSLVANGYTEGGIVENEVSIHNGDATTLYLHLTDNGTNPPATGTDGLEIGTAPTSVYTLPKGTDLATTWFYASPTINVVKVGVN